MKSKKAKQEKASQKQKDFQVFAFILFTFGFFVIFAIRPSISLIYTLQKEKAEYKKIDQTLETKIQDIISTQAQFMELINNKALVDEALPSSPLPAEKTVELAKKFLNKNITINSFGVQKISLIPKTQTGLNTVTVNVDAQAKYQSFWDFLDYVNNSRRLLSLDSLELNTDNTSSSSALLNFTTTMKTYYYIEENNADEN